MAISTATRSALFEDLAAFERAILSYVGPDGYPVNVATSFREGAEGDSLELAPPSVPTVPADGAEVSVIFSHIRPAPGVGYDQRRYITVWGTVRHANGSLLVTPERVHGWDEERMSFFELCERSVPAAHRYMQRLSAERGRLVKPQLSIAWLFFLATRLPFLTATVVPVLLGGLVARAQGFSAWWYFLLAFVGGVAIHLGLNVANDVYDSTSGADKANVNPTMYSGGSRMIQYGLLDVRAMRAIMVACYALGMAIGIFLVATRGWGLLWIGVTGLLISFFYTAPPLRLVYRGLGEICVALGFGPLMVLGTYYVVAQRLAWEALYVALPVGLLIMLVLYVNQIPDRPADATAGKRTIVVILGKGAIVKGYGIAVAAAFALIALGPLLASTPVWTLLALLPAPLALKVYRAIDQSYYSPYELMDAMGKNILLHLSVGLLLSVGYLIDILI
jgi:1,4-dihydroxy-2-naphthoate polyprenyltransferase